MTCRRKIGYAPAMPPSAADFPAAGPAANAAPAAAQLPAVSTGWAAIAARRPPQPAAAPMDPPHLQEHPQPPAEQQQQPEATAQQQRSAPEAESQTQPSAPLPHPWSAPAAGPQTEPSAPLPEPQPVLEQLAAQASWQHSGDWSFEDAPSADHDEGLSDLLSNLGIDTPSAPGKSQGWQACPTSLLTADQCLSYASYEQRCSCHIILGRLHAQHVSHIKPFVRWSLQQLR